MNAITSSADGTKIAAAAYNNYIYTSADSGVTWTTQTALGSKSWFGVQYSADGSTIAASAAGGDIYLSKDAGATWNDVSSGLGTKVWVAVALATVSTTTNSNSIVNSGWDGWIHLSGANHVTVTGLTGTNLSSQGVSYNPIAGLFSGYAWGSQIMGWLQFTPTLTNGTIIATSTCNGCNGITTDLTLQAQDIGIGSGGTGSWLPSVTYTLPSVGGSVTIPIRWTVNSATHIQIAASDGSVPSTPVITDWGVNSGSTVTSLGLPVTANGSTFVTYSTAGTKTLTLSYKLGTNPKILQVVITVNPPITGNPGGCSLPSNATFCSPTDKVNIPINARSSSAMCTNNTTCEYYCNTGYRLQGNLCVKSTIHEI